MPINHAKEKDIQRFSEEYVSSGDTVLDVGCADGYTYELIRESLGNESFSYVGVDHPYWEHKDINLTSDSQTEYAEANAQNLPFSDNSFDIIILSHVLEHLYHLSEPLSEVKRVTKKKGKILIIVPLQGLSPAGLLYRYRNPRNAIISLSNRVGLTNHEYPGQGHNQHYLFGQWKKRISEGFSIVDCHGWGGLRMTSHVVVDGYLHFISSVLRKLGVDIDVDFAESTIAKSTKRGVQPYIVGTYVAEPR